MVALTGVAETRPTRRGWTVVLTTLGATVAGVLLTVHTLNPAAVQRPSSFHISDDVPTSFGIVAVEFVRSVDGISHRALPAGAHGVSDPATSSSQHIQVAVAITNQTHQPLKYTVHQFELQVTTAGKTSVLAATAADLPDGRILPAAGIEGHLDFTLPSAKSALSLHFRDPGRTAPIVIDLGEAAATASPVRVSAP